MKITEIYSFEQTTKLERPLFLTRIPAGYPSPGDNYIEKKLDLNEYLIKHPAATFFVRVEGDSMINGGIHSADILVVDRAITACHGDIVIAIVNGEVTIKRLVMKSDKLYLVAENSKYPPFEITPEMNFEIWGKVTYVIHKV